jgi:hypothetical protein
MLCSENNLEVVMEGLERLRVCLWVAALWLALNPVFAFAVKAQNVDRRADYARLICNLNLNQYANGSNRVAFPVARMLSKKSVGGVVKAKHEGSRPVWASVAGAENSVRDKPEGQNIILLWNESEGGGYRRLTIEPEKEKLYHIIVSLYGIEGCGVKAPDSVQLTPNGKTEVASDLFNIFGKIFLHIPDALDGFENREAASVVGHQSGNGNVITSNFPYLAKRTSIGLGVSAHNPTVSRDDDLLFGDARDDGRTHDGRGKDKQKQEDVEPPSYQEVLRRFLAVGPKEFERDGWKVVFHTAMDISGDCAFGVWDISCEHAPQRIYKSSYSMRLSVTNCNGKFEVKIEDVPR